MGKHIWLVVSKIWIIFHHIYIYIWDVILPIDELHHFSRWLKPATSYGFWGYTRDFHSISRDIMGDSPYFLAGRTEKGCDRTRNHWRFLGSLW